MSKLGSAPLLESLKFSPQPRIAVVCSRYNEPVVGGMLTGVREILAEMGLSLGSEDLFWAPGAFEVPLIAQEVAKTGLFEGVVGLGCVIKGDTAHFEFVSLGATLGTLQASLGTRVPIAFGILTTYTQEQAEVRARPGFENKGREAVGAVLLAIAELRRIQALRKKSL